MIIPNQSNVTYNAVTPDGITYPGNSESNAVATEILSYSVSKIIGADKSCVCEGETVKNTVTVTNDSSTTLFGNVFKIPQIEGGNFVSGSVKINGVAQPSFDPVKGFPLPDLAVGEKVAVEYEVKASGPTVAPSVKYSATLNYTVNDPLRGEVTYIENTDNLLIDFVSDEIRVVKTVDKAFAVKGEKLHYTVTVENVGNVTKNNLVFKDPVPEGTAFVSGSVKINGTNYSVYNAQAGFALRSLAPGEVTTVEFDAEVK